MTWFKKDKTEETPKRPERDPLVVFDQAVQNVMWAREILGQMAGCVAFHKSDGHDCDAMCMPWELKGYVETLSADGVRVLLMTLLKDTIQVVGVDDHDDEIM